MEAYLRQNYCLSSSALDKYKCSICISFLDKPMVTVCGHRFCQSCLDPWIQSKNFCPLCKRHLNYNSDIFPDNFTQREIMELQADFLNNKDRDLQFVISDGCIIWYIDDFKDRDNFDSTTPPFFTSTIVYKFCVRYSLRRPLFQISVSLLPTDNDKQLNWPCRIRSCNISFFKELEDHYDSLTLPKENICVPRPDQRNGNAVFEIGCLAVNIIKACAIEDRLWVKVCIELDD